MKKLPHYGPWTESDKYPPVELTPEEEKRHREAMEEFSKPDPDLMKKWMEVLNKPIGDTPVFTAIPYSPPFPPIDPVYHQIWSAILSLGILDVQIVKKDGQLGVTFHRDQTITLEKGKFYPLVPNGGEEQQKAFGKT